MARPVLTQDWGWDEDPKGHPQSLWTEGWGVRVGGGGLRGQSDSLVILPSQVGFRLRCHQGGITVSILLKVYLVKNFKVPFHIFPKAKKFTQLPKPFSGIAEFVLVVVCIFAGGPLWMRVPSLVQEHWKRERYWPYLAVLKMVLAEIKEESAHLADQEGVYRPRTLFDFGSGVGTSYWWVFIAFQLVFGHNPVNIL